MELKTNNGSILDVTFVKPTTQKAQGMLHTYEYTKKGDSIYTAYGKPSSHKITAFNQIEKERIEVGGWGMRIIGAGSYIFSCAYKVHSEDNKTFLIYHTPLNRFAVEVL